MPLNKNEAARIRRVQQSIDKVLDALHSAQGMLYPQGLKSYRESVTALITQADKLQKKIQADLPRKAVQLEAFPEDDEPDEAA